MSRVVHQKTPLLERLFAGHHDILSALRSLRRSPGFVAIAVLSLGLAIGLNTTMLAMIDAIVHPFIPYREPARLFSLVPYGMTREKHFVWREMYLAARARTDLYQDMVPMAFSSGVAEANGHFDRIGVVTVGTRLFEVLGVQPMIGRTFSTTGVSPADAGAAVIGYQLWQQDFAANPKLAGLQLTFAGRTYSVIGVMPPSVTYPSGADVWLAMPRAEETSSDGPAWVQALMRLKPGDRYSRVKAMLNALARQDAAAFNADPTMFDYRLETLLPNKGRPTGTALLTAVISTLVLLVACLNLANLMLVRGLSRRRELAVRMALGANRAAVMRHVFVECAMLAGLGGLWGVLLSAWGVKLAESNMPTMIQQLGFVTPHASWRVVAIGILVTGATVIVAGLAPALHAARANVSDAMKDGGSTTTGRHSGLYRLVVVGEIAVSLVVTIVGAFWIRSLYQQASFRFSYDADHMLSSFVVPRRSCDSLAARSQFWTDMVRRVTVVPGVQYAVASVYSYTKRNQVTSDEPGSPITIPLGRGTNLGYTTATSQYFKVYGYPIIAGRDFQDGDADGQGAAIVDRELAAKLWPFSSPVGRLIKLGPAESDAPWVRVVGVVGPRAAHADSTSDGTPLLTITRPIRCSAASFDVHTTGPPAPAAGPVYHAVRAAVPAEGYVTVFRSPKAAHDADLRLYELVTLMFFAFGAFSLLLSGVGVYGVLSYAVGQRIREFAMRTALGAGGRDIARIVVRDALEMALGGTALGGILTLAVFFGPFQNAHGLEGAIALAAAETVVIAATLAGCVVPIRRASNADPVDLLRST